MGLDSSDYFNSSSPEIKWAINTINCVVHEIESFIRAKENYGTGTEFLAVTIEFTNPTFTALPTFCDLDFTLNTNFGDLVLHYCQTGKTWWEVFIDEDEDIFPEAVIPLKVVSGEVVLFLGEVGDLEQRKKNFQKFLIEQGQNPSDPNLRLGFNVVATLDKNELSKDDIINTIGSYSSIRELNIYKDDKIIAQKKFLKSKEFIAKHFDASFWDNIS